MKQSEYIKTIVLDGKMINIGLDDYGQCYFFEYVKDGTLKEVSCGTYCPDYMQEIKDYFGVASNAQKRPNFENHTSEPDWN